MAPDPKKLAKKEVILFLIVAFALSSIFYYLIATAQSASDATIFTIALMWCPATAAILTRLYYQKDLGGFGVRWGETKWQLVGIFLPIAIGLAMFGSVWIMMDSFNAEKAVQIFSLSFLPSFAIILAFNLFAAMGEELGWRGLLVPELSKFMGFTKLALLSGVIWTVWHFPIIIFGTYHGTGPIWYSLAMFIPSVIGAGVILAWLRLKSGSVWPAVFFHGFWNYFIQGLYPALTIQTQATEMITGEFGWASPLAYILLALVCWHYRGLLKKKTKTRKEKHPSWLGPALVLIGAIVLISFILPILNPGQKPTDYSKSEHWLSLPSSPEKEVDVFYLYPTSYQKSNESDPNICEIDNPSMLKNSKAQFAGQATAFEPVANIYAPYYRQVDAVYSLALPLEEQDKIVGDIPASDAITAFDYYITNYNNGRPFILAGHSQGSNVMLYLLSDYMKKNPKVYDRMIAAYVIGYSITDDYLAKNSHLKFAEGPDDTGVIVSYNTEAPNVTGNNPVLLSGANVINPITWTKTEELATAEQSLGSLLLDEEGKLVTVNNYADARVDNDRGVVICSTADVEKLSPGNSVFGKGVYHIYDYSFYYFDIRENAANRIDGFLSRQRLLSENG
ncbi:MAG: DUF3089 domain-containing protein [Candidatus Micrarchaeota archaeon]